MAITDDLDNARRQVAVDATPGAAAIAPRPSAGTVAGTALRSGLAGAGLMAGRARQQAAGAARNVVAGSTAPARAGLGVVRDAGRAFQGLAPSENAGRPVGLPSLPSRPTLPSLQSGGVAPNPRSAPQVQQYRRPSTTPAATAPRADFSDVASRVAPAAAPAAAAAGAAGGILRATDAAGNNVYSDSAAGLQQGVQLANGGPSLSTAGIAPAGAPGPAAGMPTAPRPAPAVAATVAAPRPVPTQAVRGRQGAVIQNPNDTLVDKLTRAMGSASLKGSPSARAAVAQAILGQEGAQRDERMQTLRTQDQADLAAMQGNATAAEGDANRQMEASRTNAQLADSAAGRENSLEISRLARRPEVSVSADGSMGIIAPDGTWRPVTGADGAAVRAPQAPRQTGELTDGERLKSYTDRYNAILNDATSNQEQKAAAVAALDADPIYSGLRGRAPVEGAKQAPDGNWYVQDADGGYSKVNP